MKTLKNITDGRKLRKYGLSKKQTINGQHIVGLRSLLAEENTMDYDEDGCFIVGQIHWVVDLENGESIKLQKAFLELGMWELTEAMEKAEREIVATASGFSAKNAEIYFEYDLQDWYLKMRGW